MSFDEWRFTFGQKTKAEIDSLPQDDLKPGMSVWNSDLQKPEYVSSYLSSSACAQGMDVVFVVDYTSSMGSAINGIKTSITSITNKIITESGNNYRLGLVIFDEWNSGTVSTYSTNANYTSLPASQRLINTGQNSKYQWITTMAMMATNNITPFTTQLNKLNGVIPIGGGVGSPEPADFAVSRVNNQNFAGTFRSNVAKLIILVTDNLPGWDSDVYDQSVIDRINDVLTPELQSNGVRVLLMSTYSPNALDTMALATGGVVSSSFAPEAIVAAIGDTCAIIANGIKKFVNEDCIILINASGGTLVEGQIVRINSGTTIINGCTLATSLTQTSLCGVVYRGGLNNSPIVVAIQGLYKVLFNSSTLPINGRLVNVSTTPGEGNCTNLSSGIKNCIGVCAEYYASLPGNRLVKCMIQNYSAL